MILFLMYSSYCVSNFRLRSISSRSSTDDRLNTPSVLSDDNNNNYSDSIIIIIIKGRNSRHYFINWPFYDELQGQVVQKPVRLTLG